MNQNQLDRTETARESLKSILTGFFLAVALTLPAFGLVALGSEWSRWIVFSGIFAAALVQALVHLHYFLHFRFSTEFRANLVIFVICILIIILFVAGSLWIMSSLNYRMM